MSKEALLPCFKCGKTMNNVSSDADNQPHEGTEFRTYGHYGSTVWDSPHGEELVLNVCEGACMNTPTGSRSISGTYPSRLTESGWSADSG